VPENCVVQKLARRLHSAQFPFIVPSFRLLMDDLDTERYKICTVAAELLAPDEFVI
jgi:hypothetical protein